MADHAGHVFRGTLDTVTPNLDLRQSQVIAMMKVLIRNTAGLEGRHEGVVIGGDQWLTRRAHASFIRERVSGA
jgi:hypothetical protein